MKGYFTKVSRAGRHGFIPADESGEKLSLRLGDGEIAQMEVVQIRSLPWHRMYFGICRSIGDNQDPARDESSIDYELRIRSGHFDVMFVQDHEVRIPKRIAFAKMDADAWAEYWAKVEPVIVEVFGDGYVQEWAA